MPSSPASFNGHAQISPSQSSTTSSLSLIFRPSSRRTPSLSSNSSLQSLSSNDDSPLFAPRTPLHFLGIPFSWEQIPGIPKKQIPKKREFPSLNFLPLPPAGTPNPSSKKSNSEENSKRDPFLAALVECSKDDHDQDSNICKGSRVNRTLSGRLGFMTERSSCKRNCAVSESIIFLPGSR